jgi:cytochrome c556
MLRIIAGLLALGLTASVALAENLNAIKERQQIMFDLAKVKASLKTFQDNAAKLKTLWPEDSKTGGDTRALPAIWTNMKDYLAWFDGFAKDSKAAEAAIKDEASFKTEWPKVVDYCGSCHKDYRAAKK